MVEKSVMLDYRVENLFLLELGHVERAVEAIQSGDSSGVSSGDSVFLEAIISGWYENDASGNIVWKGEYRIRNEKVVAYMKVSDDLGNTLFEGRMPWYIGADRISYLFYNIFLGVRDKMFRAESVKVSG